MRKSRVKINVVSEPMYLNFLEDPTRIAEHTAALEVRVPDWTTVMLVYADDHRRSIEFTFFEDGSDFFVTYSKKVIRDRPGASTLCFSSEGGRWKAFTPPTLIGVRLTTRLRKKA